MADAPKVLPTLLNTLRVTGDAGGGFLSAEPGTLASFPLLTSTLVPADLGAGSDKTALILADWSQLIIAFCSHVGLLTNPFESNAYARGNIQIRAMLTADVAVRHPEAFAVAVDV